MAKLDQFLLVGFIDLVKGLVGKSDWDYKERRGKMRARCRIEANLMVGTGLIGAEIQDVSVKGMRLMCLGKVKKGAQTEIRGVKQHNQAEVHSLHCLVEWTKKKTPGWMVGVSFLDSTEKMSKSWLFWELKSQAVRMRGSDQKRETYRVKCVVPARITSLSQNLQARLVNLSTEGALVQTSGQMMKVGESVTLRFGPLENLPKISVKAIIAGVHVDGSPTYGINFLTFEAGSPSDLKKYLDCFFKR